MEGFIDVEGASGARYRFRLAPDHAALPATAGNFIFARRDAGGPRLVGCDSANNLAEVTKLWAGAVDEQHADSLYVYLNVARRTRNEVHENIAEKHHPAPIAVDLGL
jgi:hypothetical protein